jgi:RNA polymerase sigma factor (TIGR02999 family)
MLAVMADVTEILNAIERGDPKAAAELLPLVYEELRRLAAARLAEERPGQTLQATALVHEAYIRLVGHDVASQWNGSGHFFAAAAEAMRRILVERARRKGRVRHGGGRRRVELGDRLLAESMPPDLLMTLDEALTRLGERDSQAAELVKLHCFTGLPIDRAADALGISQRTAYRDWEFAQAWLYREIRDTAAPEE